MNFNYSMNFLDNLIILAGYKRILVLLPSILFLFSLAYVLFSNPIFEGQTILMPPEQQQNGAAAIMAQLAGVSGGIGAAALNLKNPNDLYVGMLQSKSIGRNIVSRFRLERVYGDKTASDALNDLAKRTDIVSGKDGLIVVTVRDTSPVRAAQIANCYADELKLLTKRLAVTEGGQRRLFFEIQLKEAKQHLADAEVELKRTQEKTGVLQLEDQGRAAIDSLASIKAQISAKEVQLTVMKKSMTETNPYFSRTEAELQGLNEQLKQMLNGQGNDDDGVMLAKSKAPELSLLYIRKLRDVKYYEVLFELIAKQYEMAKMDEDNQGAVIQIVDIAIPPEKKSSPKSGLVLMISVLFGVMLAVMVAFIKDALSKLGEDPEYVLRLKRMKDLILK